MKKKWFKNKEIIDYITSTNQFKIIFILAIITAIYGSFILSAGQKDFFNSIILTHTFPYFNIMFFSLLALNTIHTCTMFCRNENYMIRLQNKKTVLKELIKIVFQVNLLLIIAFLLLYFMFLMISQLGYFTPKNYFNYDITTFGYSIFFILRYYIFALVFAVLNTIIYHKWREQKAIVIDFIFILLFGFVASSGQINTNFQFLPWQYYSAINYGTFSLELNYSILYLLILEIIILLLFYNSLKKKNPIIKYLLHSDRNYLLKKQWKIILLFILFPILVLVMKLKDNPSGIIILADTLGLNNNPEMQDVIGYIMYLFNIAIIVFLTIFTYIKDYQTNLDQIYLRTDFKKFYIPKTILLIGITLIIKLLQYIPLVIILGITNHLNVIGIQLVKIYLIDSLFVSILAQLFLGGYLISGIFKKLKPVCLMIGILLFIILPKNLINIQSLLWLFLFLLILVCSINYQINYKYNKKIIQQIGGV